jgi:hypothetical protein
VPRATKVVPTEQGFDVLAFTYQGCDGRSRHVVHVDRGGQLNVHDNFVERDYDPGCIVGRRPEGLASRPVLRTSLGRLCRARRGFGAGVRPARARAGGALRATPAPWLR